MVVQQFEPCVQKLIVAVAVFLCVFYLKPSTNWGTSTQAAVFRSALVDALKLIQIPDHVKNYRPLVLALTGLPCVRPALVYLANGITRATGMLICGHVMVGESAQQRKTVASETYKWLRRTHVKAFYDSIVADSFADGAKALIQTSGLGKMKPNVLLMGYMGEWKDSMDKAVEDYVSVVQTALDNRLGVMILYAKEGFDISEAVNFDQLVLHNNIVPVRSENNLLSLSGAGKGGGEVENVSVEVKEEAIHNPQLQARVQLSRQFEAGKKRSLAGEIHVWWLYDDGGLGLLVAYLLTQSSPWNACRLRVFCVLTSKPVGSGKSESATIDAEVCRHDMRALLDKFRIQAVEVVVVDLQVPPSDGSVNWFNDLISAHRQNQRDVPRKSSLLLRPHFPPPVIKDLDLFDLQEKTRRHIRIRDLLLEHSHHSLLNVITMPLPKRNGSAALYLATLETLTSGMPPTLLVRGTHENVLTYYC